MLLSSCLRTCPRWATWTSLGSSSCSTRLICSSTMLPRARPASGAGRADHRSKGVGSTFAPSSRTTCGRDPRPDRDRIQHACAPIRRAIRRRCARRPRRLCRTKPQRRGRDLPTRGRRGPGVDSAGEGRAHARRADRHLPRGAAWGDHARGTGCRADAKPVGVKYDAVVNRESAYEILSRRAAPAVAASAPVASSPAGEAEKSAERWASSCGVRSDARHGGDHGEAGGAHGGQPGGSPDPARSAGGNLGGRGS